MTDFYTTVVPMVQRSEAISWSNCLVNSPAVYSLLEKRILYYLTLQIKHRFVEKGLDSPEAWEDLHFHLTDRDLGIIGGKTHVLQTYEALSDIGSKFMSISYYNSKKQLIYSNVHWVDSFSYNTVTKQYDIRMSPEIMPYLINLAKGFTVFCAQTALSLRSKYSQKFYEFCCEFSGNFRYPRAKTNDLAFKKNVYPMRVEHLRSLLDLNEKLDERTGKIKSKEKYGNYKDLRRNVLLPALRELYELYHEGRSEVWFDCVPFQREGRKIISVLFFIYSKNKPKQGLQKLWEEGDTPLNPFEDFTDASVRNTPSVPSLSMRMDAQKMLQQVEIKLSTYLESNEVEHYLNFMKETGCFDYDSCSQVIQLIEEKERQPKFKSGTMAYKRKSIMHYALQENLKNFGWSIPEPKGRRQSLFRS